MAKPVLTFRTVESPKGELRLCEFEIPGGVTSPAEAAEAVGEIKLSGPLPTFFSGRGPVWLYGMLLHEGHATPANGTYEPRGNTFVVCATHDVRFSVGEEIAGPK